MSATSEMEAPRTWTFEMMVERGKLIELARALRVTDGPYGPSGRGDEASVAPPTYPVVMNHWGPSGTEILTSLGCDMRRVVHGEEAYEYHHGPLREGQRLLGTTTLADRHRKEGRRGGTMEVFVLETELKDIDTDEVAVRIRRTIIERTG